MPTTYNVYCDESCHLEHDGQKAMVLGAVSSPAESARTVSRGIRDIKLRHGLAHEFEIKWTKVSPGKVDFYLEVIEYFFSQAGLGFRAVVIPDKSQLNHAFYQQTHDEWYYKMYFYLLREIVEAANAYRVYIDIKDTRSEVKRAKLQTVLRNYLHDPSGTVLGSIQQIRSHESNLLQMADLLIGAMHYCNEGLTDSSAKRKIIDLIRKRSKKKLIISTAARDPKFSVLIWKPGGSGL